MTVDGVKKTTLSSQELVKLIRRAAEQGDFRKAEALRETLMQTDSLELNLIVSTGEIIEAEKTRQIDEAHLFLWSLLYEPFSIEERNALFYCLTQAVVEPGKLLLVQGKPNHRLFFIEAGRVEVFFRKLGENVRIAELKSGDILGEDTFFESSHCTFSAATTVPVQLRYVSRMEARELAEKHPGLDEKLAQYCRAHDKCRPAVRKRGLERRTYPRYSVEGVGIAYILDKDGNRTSAHFKGRLIDISRTGLSLFMKASRQDVVHSLLSRNLAISLSFDGGKTASFQIFGTVVKLTYHMYNDYKVFVRFHQPVEADLFRGFPCAWDDGAR
jgi:CRP-like cAMP-binding protein